MSCCLILQMWMNSTELQNPRRKLDDKCLSLSYVCVRFCSCLCKVCPRVSEAVLLTLQTLSLLTLPQSVRLSFIAFSGSPTSVHCPLHALWYYTVGIHFWTAHKRESQTSKLNEKKHTTTCSSHLITHYRYVHVTERYTETLQVKKMADLVAVT